MTITPDSLKRDLADGAAASAKADRSGEEIRRAAESRREQVQARLSELRPTTGFDADAAQEYGDLVRERGELDLVLGRGSVDE